MPVEVPKEPKRYTTVYENFKGVDFTDDPSNVFRRRSPSGLNMLPDLAGNPHKRTGWDIKFSADDFIEAAGAQAGTEVSPERLHHFSYGGHDYIVIFNSLGVFYTADNQKTVTLAELATKDGDDYTISQFPPEVRRKKDGVIQTVVMPADANKAFFFEGGGEAGFYVFVENSLYKFTNVAGGMYFVKVEPYVPVIIIGATPAYGNGTNYDSINLLTDRRSIQYFGDGTANYKLPEVPVSADTTVVEILDNNSGEWVEIPQLDPDYPWTLSDDTITFTSGKPPTSVVDNVRITYSPDEAEAYNLIADVRTSVKEMTITREERHDRSIRIEDIYSYSSANGWVKVRSSRFIGAWRPLSARNMYGKSILNTPGLFSQHEFVLYGDYTGTMQPLSEYNQRWGAYNSSVTVSSTDSSIAKQYGDKKETVRPEVTTNVQENTSGSSRRVITHKKQEKIERYDLTFNVLGVYTQQVPAGGGESIKSEREAFANCRKVLPYGNNLSNQIFISASSSVNYSNRVWYCAANNPAYFPDTNYIEVGADDKQVMGLINVDQYLGLVKLGNESSIGAALYLAYPTSFEDDATYAVKQSVAGVGAISTGAFNILNDEPLFLSERGVMGIDISNKDANKQIRNRSYFVNKRLMAEKNLSDAVSYVFGGLYYLAINNSCYVLDGSQKSSWANEKTNFQYECYYLDNLPAQCFADMGGVLYFSDFDGNLCYFKDENDPEAYIDRYLTTPTQWQCVNPPEEDEKGMYFNFSDISGTSGDSVYLKVYDPEGEDNQSYLRHDDDGRLLTLGGDPVVNDTMRADGLYYTIREIDGKKAYVSAGVPISAQWSTLADDDEMVQFFKNLNKKGCVVSLYPENQSGVEVWLKPDEKEPVKLPVLSTDQTTLPFDAFIKKKIKKYKRLQIICLNNTYNEGFGVDQIIKTYTVGNYSKNRR